MRIAFTSLLLLATALAFACDDDSSGSGLTPTIGITPTPRANASASAAPAATPTLIPLARTPTIGPDAPFPDDIALIVETGCWQCDGGPSGLVRLYRDPAGVIRTDRLSDNIGNFLSFSASMDGARLTASICMSGVCDGFNEPTPPPVIEKVMSEDGGITWSPLSADGGVAAVLRERVVLRRAANSAPNQWRYVDYPTGAELPQPPLSDPASSPFAVSPTEIRWLATDGRALIDEGASVTYILDQDGAAGLEKDDRIHDARIGETSVFLHIVPGGDAFGPRYVAWAEPNNWDLKTLLAIQDSFVLGPALDADTVMANVTYPAPGYEFLPSIIDLDTGTIRPIREPFGTQQGFVRGRNYILGVMHGPFARVVSPGDCLNIREAAALSASVLACTADGVLLLDGGVTQDVDGRSWRSVTTAAGVEGWADVAFLEVGT